MAEADKPPEFDKKQGQISTETKKVSANTFGADFSSLLTHLGGVLASRDNSANTVSKPVSNPANTVSKVRWYQNKAGAIIIVPRGKDRRVLATISPKDGLWTHLYPSWERVLAELEALKSANSVSRISHDGLLTGEIPVSKDEKC